MASEKRLIDVNALKWKLSQVTLYVLGLRFGKTIISKILESYRRAVFEEIDNAPTVDAVEVVHARWVSSGCGFDCCSVCRKVYTDGYFTAMGIKPRAQFNYCPNCGAKMDGGNEDV